MRHYRFKQFKWVNGVKTLDNIMQKIKLHQLIIPSPDFSVTVKTNLYYEIPSSGEMEVIPAILKSKWMFPVAENNEITKPHLFNYDASSAVKYYHKGKYNAIFKYHLKSKNPTTILANLSWYQFLMLSYMFDNLWIQKNERLTWLITLATTIIIAIISFGAH